MSTECPFDAFDQYGAARGYVWDVGTLDWVRGQQPVVDAGTVTVSGPIAVTGTFYQPTQPVSIASMPSTPVTGTFYQVTQPVSIASMPSTPVTGTFWQSTQPVSIASMPSTPVTGTFWQSTQPVSLATAPLTSITWNGTAPPIGAGVEATALRVTLATDSTGQTKLALSTAEIGNVKNSGTFAVQVSSGSVTEASAAGIKTDLDEIALDTDNLATIQTNTLPLATATAGGYIRQDSTVTIAKEQGGNLDLNVFTLSLILTELKLLRQAFQDWTGTTPRLDPSTIPLSLRLQ